MDVTQTQTSIAPSRAQPDAAEPSDASALSSDFETFLRMLTVQMENQDPLNPIESSDFAVQLATFSGVEQQVRTNDILGELTAALGGSAMSQFADWIGKDARVAAPAYFDGSPIPVETATITGADTAELVVRDQSGSIVDRRAIPLDGGSVSWNGISELGNPFLDGLYRFSVESRADGELLGETEGEVYLRIAEARLDAEGGVELVFDGGGVASSGDVSALRQAPGG